MATEKERSLGLILLWLLAIAAHKKEGSKPDIGLIGENVGLKARSNSGGRSDVESDGLLCSTKVIGDPAADLASDQGLSNGVSADKAGGGRGSDFCVGPAPNKIGEQPWNFVGNGGHP